MPQNIHNQSLLGLHRALLHLHKSLLEYVRVQFESVYGKIENPHDYLAIVMQHEAFAWLRILSELIVSIDETSEGREGAKEEKEILSFAKELLTPNEEGEGFSKKYAEALQDSPEVLHAHGQVVKEIKRNEE